jgi:hypothetical protein
MNILVTCPCGKRLQTSEASRGKRIKCPACGEILPVTGEPDSKKTGPRPLASPAKPARLVDDNSDAEDPPRKKKKKKARSFSLPEFEVFGLTFGKLLILLAIIGVIALGIWLIVPSSTAQIVEVRRVDVYAALDVGEKGMNRIPEALKLMGRALRRGTQRELGVAVTDDEPDALYLGDNKLLISHDNSQGDSLVLRFALSPRFLSKRANIQNGTIMVQASDVVLRGEGGDVQGLLIDAQRALPKVLQISFYGATQDSQFTPHDRPPWTHPGKFSLDDLKKEILPPDDKGNKYITYTGTARFEGRSGMLVNYTYDGSAVELTWDKDSKALISSKSLQFSASEYTFGTLELTCVFSRPAGRYVTPIVMGAEMSKLKLP